MDILCVNETWEKAKVLLPSKTGEGSVKQGLQKVDMEWQ